MYSSAAHSKHLAANPSHGSSPRYRETLENWSQAYLQTAAEAGLSEAALNWGFGVGVRETFLFFLLSEPWCSFVPLSKGPRFKSPVQTPGGSKTVRAASCATPACAKHAVSAPKRRAKCLTFWPCVLLAAFVYEFCGFTTAKSLTGIQRLFLVEQCSKASCIDKQRIDCNNSRVWD